MWQLRTNFEHTRLLMNPFPNNDNATFQYHEELDILIVRWMSDTHISIVKDIYINAIEYCTFNKCSKILMDIRRRNIFPIDLEEWFINDYMDIIAHKLPLGVRLSYLMSPTKHQEMTQEKIFSFDNSFCCVGIFVTELEATNWLTR